LNGFFSARLRRALPLAAVTSMLLFSGALACSDDDDDDEQPTAVPTGGAQTESPGGTRTGTSTSGSETTRPGTAGTSGTGTPGTSASGTSSPGAGGDRQTGVAEVDAVIAMIEAGDAAAVAAEAAFIQLKCVSQSQGSGGLPQCQSGETEGTDVSVFPVVGCEGEHIREDDLDEYLEQRFAGQDPSLYAVVQHTEPPESEQFPTGDYGAIFELSGQNGAMVGISEQGEVVTLVTLCNASPEDILDEQTGDVVVEPED
jgi:hypothetical protein